MFTDKHGNKYYKVGLHIHTTRSDGRRTPEEVAKIYADAGYDAIAFTDHRKYSPAGSSCGLTILPGCEYDFGGGNTSGCVMHIVGIGMTCDPQIDCHQLQPQDIINAINAHGGAAILAHPAWSLNTIEHVRDLHGFSGVEIYNTVSDCHESFRPDSSYFIDICANEGIIFPICAADDSHYYDGDEACSFIMVKADDSSAESLTEAIKNGDFYASQGLHLDVKRYGHHIVVDCSECDELFFISNRAWVRNRARREGGIVHAEYITASDEHWVRVEARKGTKKAWSHILAL